MTKPSVSRASIRAAVAIAIVAAACGGGSAGGATGGLRQGCYPNGTCNTGLTCLSEVCVEYGYDGGLDSGGSSSGGGSGSGGGDGSAVEAGPTVAQAAAALAQATCDQELSCLGAAVGYVDLPTCATRSTLYYIDNLEAPGTSSPPSAYLACASAITAATCNDFVSYWQGVGAIPACQGTAGTLPPGTACAYSEQCASNICEVASDSNCGVCGQPTDGVAGSACVNSSECAGSLVCEPSNVCTPLGAAGAACNSNLPCQYPFGCTSGNNAGALGYCEAAPVGTAACNVTNQTCAIYEFCSSITTRCEAMTWAPPGGTCGWVAGNSSDWRDCAAGACTVPSGALMTSTCPAVAQDGQPCDATTPCVPPATCTSNGTCVVPQAATCK